MSCGSSQPARAMVAAAPTATALPPVSPCTSVATIVPVSIAAAPPWKKIPVAANFPNRRARSSTARPGCFPSHPQVSERNAYSQLIVVLVLSAAALVDLTDRDEAHQIDGSADRQPTVDSRIIPQITDRVVR
jgi:hypothetical protein